MTPRVHLARVRAADTEPVARLHASEALTEGAHPGDVVRALVDWLGRDETPIFAATKATKK